MPRDDVEKTREELVAELRRLRAQPGVDMLRSVLDQLPVLVAYIDPDQVFRLANRAYSAWFQRAPEEIVGEHIVTMLGEAAYAIARPHVEAALAGERRTYEAELPYRERDGGPRHVQASYVPHRDASGRVLGIVALVIDISARKQAELALWSSREQLEVVLRGVADGITMQDASGRLVYVNDEAARLSGFSGPAAMLAATREELLGRFEMFDESGATMPPERLPGRRALRGERVEDVLIHYRPREGGADRWSLVSATPIHDPSGALRFVVNILKDVTAQRAAAAERAESERRFQAVFDSALDAIMLADDAARLVEANRAACELLGLPREQLLTRQVPDLSPPGDREAFLAHWQEFLREGEQRGELLLLRGDGSTLEVEYSASAHVLPGRHLTVLRDISARRRTERALSYQHKLTQTITDNASSGLFLIDEGRRCTYMNPAAAEMTGYTLAEVQGRPLEEVIGGPSPAERPIARATREQAPTRGEDLLFRRGGRRLPVAFTASPIVEDGGAVGSVLEVRDIAEEQRTGDALRLQAQVLQSMAEGVCVVDVRGTILLTNAAEDALFGCAPGERLGRPVTSQTADPEGVHARLVSELFAEPRRSAWTGELDNVRADGTRFTTLARISALELSGERLLVRVQTDVTQEKRDREAQQFLARASALLGASLEQSKTLQDLAELAVPALGTWCQVFTREGEGPAELVAVAHRDPARAELLRELHRRFPPQLSTPGPMTVLRTGAGLRVTEVTDAMLRAAVHDPEELEMVQTLAPRSWISAPLAILGRVFGVLSVTSDEPGRRYDAADQALLAEVARRASAALENARLFALAQRERARAEEANRAKDLFLSTLSHELRTPLTAILGWTRMLRTHALSDEKREKGLETIDRNARAQVAIIEDILDLSRIVTGKLRLDLRPTELDAVIESALDTVRPAADARAIRLLPALDPAAGAVIADPERLQQVVWNLLTNAVKFTPRGGEVRVWLRRDGSQVEIVVADTGQGLDPEFLPHVFDRFRQADASTTRSHGGLGLGLAIAKHLVELHGGAIFAESEGPGRGAVFTVRLPIAPLRATSSAPEDPRPGALADPALPPAPALAGVRVLVVDDEADTRELMASVLAEGEATVATAASAAEALALLQELRPDVLVSDIGMPGEDGYSLIRRVRALAPEAGGRTPAVALTAYARAEDRTRAMAAGFNVHVAKPIEPAELMVTVASLAGRLGAPQAVHPDM